MSEVMVRESLEREALTRDQARAVQVRGFSKTYGKRSVLEVPEITLERGKIYAFLGPNGCGKSTLFKVLAGAVLPDGKKISVFKGDVGRIGFLPQKPYVFHMSLEKNLLAGGGDVKRAEEMMEMLGISRLRKKNAAAFSGGEMAKLSLARLFMRDYELVLLDEPCAAMDIASVMQAEKLIREYAGREDRVVLLITHSIRQAERLADEVFILRDGKIIEAGPAGEVLEHPKKAETVEFLNCM